MKYLAKNVFFEIGQGFILVIIDHFCLIFQQLFCFFAQKC